MRILIPACLAAVALTTGCRQKRTSVAPVVTQTPHQTSSMPTANTTVYDKMKWHYDGIFPEDLDSSRAGTHIGMFLAWCVMNNLESENLRSLAPSEISALRLRKITGREFLENVCDETFAPDQLSDTGQRFASAYYEGSGAKPEDTYMNDYDATLCNGLASAYHVQDTWENFDKIAAKIDIRFKALPKRNQ